MKKKTFIAAISVLVMLSSLFWSFQGGQITRANPYFEVDIPQMYIVSPTSSTFLSNDVTLTFWCNGFSVVEYSHVEYLLDWKILGTVDGFKPSTSYSFALTNLTEGSHTVSVTATVTAAKSHDWYVVFTWTGSVQITHTVTFTVDTVGPNLVFRTPQNKSFSTDTAAINFIAEEPLNTLWYSLDGRGKFSLNDNNLVMYHYIGAMGNYQITLSHLMEGSHSLKVYAKDSVGNVGESETLQFTVKTTETQLTVEPTQEPQPNGGFPIMLVAVAAMVIVAVVSFGLAACFVKLRKKASKS